GPGEIVVRLHATGVNPVETYQRSGSQGYQGKLPFTPGADGAGEVVTVGADVTGFAPGDRVYVSGSITGTYAQQCLCSADQVNHLPESLSYEEGACLWINYGTAYRALFQRGGARAGERVLIHGATGGVGIAAVQWARHAGLEVLGTFGSAAGEQLLAAEGVERLFNHHEDGYLDAIAGATDGAAGSGIDLVVEMLANVNLEADLDLLARGGRVVIVGSRGSIEITPRKLMGREADVRGLMLYGSTPDERREIHASIAAAGRAGSLRPVIQRSLPLAEAAEAHRAVMEDPSHGKIVLVP
ncbi:MAG TPA: NADPH:quinone reductase, partial [Spirochaetia bacterium]|nr:NADPH:quinone reductase [Spirochaetia bacterium]